MQDMIETLGSLREKDLAGPASAETVAADVARARRARSRRRLWRVAGTGVVAAVATVVATGGTTAGAQHNEAASAPSAPAAQQRSATAVLPVQLTAYTGVQPDGFTVATVPSGWTVRSSDAFAFVVQPPGDTSHMEGDFENAITVMLQGDSSGPTLGVTPVTVNGRPGTLGASEGGLATLLLFPDGKGHQVLVQVFTKYHLSNAQIIQFADGVGVTDAVQTAKG